MSNPERLARYLRFALQEDLAARNAHHDFEHVCRHVARGRLASNLLPATGPVSAGGDSGSDFETFPTALLAELGPHGGFLAHVSKGTWAFACTIQREELATKIAADVAKIANGGAFDRVYALTAAPLPKGRRSKLIAKVAADHGLELVVLDGEWLVEQLAAADLFWIAHEYLLVPVELAPAPPGEDVAVPDWYRADRDKWRSRNVVNATLAEVLDVRDGLHHATHNKAARADLPFWLSLIAPLRDADIPSRVRQRARYEYSVAVFQGQGDLRPAEATVRAYLEAAALSDDPAELAEASVLLLFAICAYQCAATDFDAQYLMQTNIALRERVRELLAAGPSPTRRARLLEVLGHLALHVDPTAVEPPSQQLAVPEASELVNEDGNPRMDRFNTSDPPPSSVDVDEAMSAWTELSHMLHTVPLMPVDLLAMMLVVLAPALVRRPEWRGVVDAVDEAIKRSQGNAAAAERAHDRALALMQSGQYRRAVDELHTAKADWWSGDSLRNSLLAMLLLSLCYRHLGLALAAKQSALSAVGAAHAFADEMNLDLVARGLAQAARSDYDCGAWCGAAELYEVAFRARQLYDSESGDPGELWAASGMHLGMVAMAARDIEPRLQTCIDSICRRAGGEQLLTTRDALAPLSPEEWVQRADEQLEGRPFSDVGPERIICFAALGTYWTVRSSIAYRHARAAERFAAAAQVLLVELSDDDLCLLPSRIDVTVEVTTEDLALEDRVLWAASNEKSLRKVLLSTAERPADLDAEQLHLELLHALTTILLDVSLLPAERYFQTLDSAYKRGLAHKLVPPRPYDDLAEVVSAQRYDLTPRGHARPPADPAGFPAAEHEQLAWQTGPGPTFDADTAQEFLASRYTFLVELLVQTLPRVRADGGVQEVIAALRERGWRDWHILTSMHNIVFNWRLNQTGESRRLVGQPDGQRQLHGLFITPENEQSVPVPLKLLTEQALDDVRAGAMLSLLHHWKLKVRQRTPDISAIERLLSERYGYWADDIEHEDPFAPGT
jgi:tetratricopeptide (TPR) repeat protein